MSEANDNAPPPLDAIPFSDLCAAMGEDEDTVLQRLAGILAKRDVPPQQPGSTS